MIGNPFFLISILLSAILTFFTVAFIVEIVLALFRIQGPRARANLRMLSFASLFLEISFHSFGRDNFLNPLSCISCFQKLILSLFFPDLQVYLAERHISLVSYLAVDKGQMLFKFVFIGWILVSVYMILRSVYRTYQVRRWLMDVVKKGELCHRKIQNPRLRASLEAAKTHVIISNAIVMPLATYSGQIMMPKQFIDKLSQPEFESIVAHELEHIHNRDPILRLLLEVISAMFWWVPTRWCKKRIEKDQEIDCDNAIKRYEFDSIVFASALIKASKEGNRMKQHVLCALASNKSLVLTRLEIILGVCGQPKDNIAWVSLVIGVEGLVLILCATML